MEPRIPQPLSRDRTSRELLSIYRALRAHFGFLNWWPGETPFEVMVGAILTQNTAWTNVEKAITGLKKEKLLNPRAIAAAEDNKLKELIRPSGYFNQKAERLKEFSRFFLEEFKGSVARMKRMETFALRDKLLAVKGIGPETADSILLYALDKPVFVVDAYTRRAFHRLGYLPENPSYEETQEFFTRHLPQDITLYNDFHAQIVYLGKDFCKARPLCGECPLRERFGPCRIG